MKTGEFCRNNTFSFETLTFNLIIAFLFAKINVKSLNCGTYN